MFILSTKEREKKDTKCISQSANILQSIEEKKSFNDTLRSRKRIENENKNLGIL